MKKLFRILMGIFATILLINAAYLWAVSNCNTGLLLLTAIGGALLLYSLFFNIINHLLDNRFGSIIKTLIFIGAITFTFITTVITMSSTTDTVNFKENALIVLGGGIHGEEVTRPLAYRLNAAVLYHKKNPDALIVVSGGQGVQELITEAEAMERYLLRHGVAPEVIIREEQATSTYENFLYAKTLLDERLPKGYKTAYTTNRFHIYRAGRLAKSAGVIASRMQADSDWITLIPDYLRECCAIIKMWMIGK